MFEFIFALGSLASFGVNGSLVKRAINDVGRHKSITYLYITLVSLLFIGALLLGIPLNFPQELFFEYLLEIGMGALGVIASFKAIQYGKVSITQPMARIYVLLTIIASIIFLGEQLSIGQIGGSVIIILSAFVLTLDKNMKFKYEKWMIYLVIAILARTYYFTFIKTFVVTMGPYPATLMLEFGVASAVILFHFLRGRELLAPIEKTKFALASGALVFMGALFYSYSVALIGAALTAAIAAGSPIINTVIARVLLKEKLEWYKYGAIITIVIGLIAIFLL